MNAVKPPYTTRQVLVCTHDRDPSTGKASCARNGAEGLVTELKKTLKERGLKGTYVATRTGCMDLCPAKGCTIAFHPDGSFFIADPAEVDGVLAHLTRVD